MKGIWGYFLVVLLIVTGLPATASVQYNFDKVPTREGETNLSVRQIIQDNKGFLWMATFSGLYRFDGDDYIFPISFRDTEINPDVTTLMFDHQNFLWIGTNNGLSKYNPVTEELVTWYHQRQNPASMGSSKIRSLCLDNENRIWIGTSDAGLYLYHEENNSFERIMLDSSEMETPLYIKTIFCGNDGTIWAGTLGNGLYSFRFKENQPVSIINYRAGDPRYPISNNNIYTIYEDTSGTMAAGTRNGLNVMEKDSDQFSQLFTPETPGGNMSNYFRSIMRDKEGKLWIATFEGLILCDAFSGLKEGKFNRIKHNRNTPNAISHNQILCLMQDNSGIIWIGSENGLNRFDPYLNQFRQFSGPFIDNLSEQTITDFAGYNDGVLMVTLSNGLLYRDQSGIVPVFEDLLAGFYNERFFSILVDSYKNIWLGSFDGLLIRIDPQNARIQTFRHSGDNIPVYSLIESASGTILVGTAGEGLKYFNPATQVFTRENSLSRDVNINDMFFDRDKNLWIATQLGIFKNRSGSTDFEYFLPDHPDSIANPNIFTGISQSNDGVIYVGGRNGLYEYDPENNLFFRKHFDIPVPLWVTNMQYDSRGNLWLNLNANRVALWENGNDKLRLYYINNGIRSIPHNRRGFYIDNHDELYVSGFDHIYHFNTLGMITNRFNPPPVFTGLIINNTKIGAGMELNNQVILQKSVEYQDRIVLNHKNKDFTLTFTSSSYLNFRENKYRYFLHGYDKQWHEGYEKSAHYTNLNPGKYLFEVYSANNDGYWSEQPATMMIRVKPSPFLSWWAIILYLAITAVAAREISKVVNARIQLRRELLIERVKRDKEEKFNEERLRFYTNISHELRTPLTLIMGPVKQLIASEKGTQGKVHLYHLILNNAQRLLSLVNQLLDFRKSLHEGMKLKATYSDLAEIVQANLDAFQFMAREKSIYVTLKSESDVVKGWFDREKVDMILFNILSNAFKNTPDHGYVRVDLKATSESADFNKKHVEIKITNTGKGIPKHLQEKVFERFFQVRGEENTLNTGSGIGLSLVKTLVELHHGKVVLESEPDKQTCFTLYIPYEREEFSDEEVFDFKRDADRRTRELLDHLTPVDNELKTGVHHSEMKKLLVVEDHSELRNFLAEYLSSEYQVLVAGDGEEGLQICEKEDPDLVISDVMMDRMDGLKFCSSLKANPEISHIPVILMTAMASVENRINGYKTGADDYITKPFEPELLRIRVSNILANREKIKKGYSTNLNTTVSELTISKTDEDFLNSVIGILEKNLDNENLDIDLLCRQLAVSSSQLYRKLKNITGLSPNEFVRTYRLKKAAVLLTASNYNISEIAWKVGFNDALYFSKCFKKQFGVSPSAFTTVQ